MKILNSYWEAFFPLRRLSAIYRSALVLSILAFASAFPATLKVTAVSPSVGSTQTTKPSQILVTFNQDIDSSSLNSRIFTLVARGADGVFGTADDIKITPASVSIVGTNQAKFDLNGVTLGDDVYRITISGSLGGTALQFDGSNDHIMISDDPSLKPTNTVTVEAWINFQSGGSGGPRILSKSYPYLEMATIGTGSTRPFAGRLNFNNSTLLIQTSSSFNAGNWHHIAMTYDGTTFRLFVNGNEEASQTVAGPITHKISSALHFGIKGKNINEAYKGKIDEVRFWNIARTQTQLQAFKDRSLAGNETGLVGYWKLNEGSGQIIKDLTSEQNDGTLGVREASEGDDPAWTTTSAPVKDGLLDLSGNLLDGDGNDSNGGDYTADFTLDTTTPTILSNYPASSATETDIYEPVSIRFSEDMNKSSVEGAFGISPSVSGSFSWYGNRDVSFKPNSALTQNTTYTVTIGTGAQDAGGASIAAQHVFSFTTGSSSGASQSLPAGLVKNLLHLGSQESYRITGFPTSGMSNMWDYFIFAGCGPEYVQQPSPSQSVDMRLAASETPMVWTDLIDGDNDGLWAENVGDQYVMYYATYVLVPSSRSAKIVFQVDSKLRVWMDGNASELINKTGSGESDVFNLSAGWHRFIFQTYDSTGSDFFGFRFANPDGSDISDLRYKLTDPVHPIAEAIFPANQELSAPTGTDVIITFSEAMDTTVTASTVASLSGGTVNGSWAWKNKRYLVWTPSGNLDPATSYTVTITAANAKDVQGNVLTGNKVFTFTTVPINTTTASNITPSVGDVGQVLTTLTLTGTNFRQGVAVHEAGALPLNGNYYIFEKQMTDWSSAVNNCISRNGHLVTLSSQQENDYVWELGGRINCWIGFSDAAQEGDYKWTNGEPWNFTNWSSDEPQDLGSEDYGIFWWSNDWNDVGSTGSSMRPYVCEFDTKAAPSVHLTKSGQSNIDATNEKFINATTVTFDIDLSGAVTGAWNVVITNPDGGTAVLANAFTVYPRTLTKLNAGIPGFRDAGLNWGDFDNDGDLDLAVMGKKSDGSLIAQVHENQNGNFNTIHTGFIGVQEGPIVWGDYNGDGKLDVVYGGWGGGGTGTMINRNDGSGTFTRIFAGLRGMKQGEADWFDYDNDGDLDVIVVGESADSPSGDYAQIYRNNGDGTFTKTIDLAGVKNSAVVVFDYDNDGDMDVVLAGSSSGTRVAKLYRNTNGAFSEVSVGLPTVDVCALACADFNNDGKTDLAIAGDTGSGKITRIYSNNGSSFSDISAGLTGVRDGALAWGDFDNDGDPDLVVAGESDSGRITTLYRNNGGTTFTDSGISLTPIDHCSVVWGDYDSDGALDLAISGDGNSGSVTEIYRNVGNINNSVPTAPTNPSASLSGNEVTFSWNAGSDSRTPVNGLTYNLRVGTTSGGNEIFSGMADTSTGLRRIPKPGNGQKKLSWKLTLPQGRYYWSVQTIDSSFAGSTWTTENAVGVNAAPTAVADTYNAVRGVQININAPGVLDNDTDSDNDPLTAEIVSGPGNGSLSLQSNGSFTYTSNSNFVGTDTFTYRCKDNFDAYSGSATVSIVVVPPPLRVTALSPTPGSTVGSAPAEILASFNENLDPATVSSKTFTLVGRGNDAVFGTGDDVSITPSSVTLVGTNQAKLELSGVVLAPDTYRVTLVGGAGSPSNLIAHWKFDEGSGTTLTDHSGNGKNGTLGSGLTWVSGKFGGGLYFDGLNNFVTIGATDVPLPWTASFWVKREDNTVHTSATIMRSSNGALKLEQWPGTKKVGITKSGVKDWPFNYEAPLDQWIHLAYVASGSNTVLYINGVQTDTLAQTIPLPFDQIGKSNAPLKGTLDETSLYNRALTLSEIQQLAQAPLGGITDSYGYALDGEFSGSFPSGNNTPGGNFVADFRLNGSPVVNDDSYSTDEDSSLNGSSVLNNDGDFPGESDTLTASLLTGPRNASSFTFNGDGTFQYTPNADFNGTDTFSYRAVDSIGGSSAPSAVTITVNSINDAPVAVNDEVAVIETISAKNAVILNVLSNDHDNHNGAPNENNIPFTAQVVAFPKHASFFKLESNGDLLYSPKSEFVGVDSFTYQTTDSLGGKSNIATVSITVVHQNRPPTLTASVSPTEVRPDEPVFFQADGIDLEDGTLTPTWDFGDGTSVSENNPTHSYPTSGIFTATVTVTDSDGLSASETFTIIVGHGPTARFTTSDVVGFVGIPLVFDAVLSTDRENQIVDYEWDFGDGSPKGSGQRIARIYEKEGVYTVTLTVTDGEGLSGSTSREIAVLPEDQIGEFHTTFNYKVKFDLKAFGRDTLMLKANVNVGDIVVGAGTNLTFEIAGSRFEGTLDTRLRDKLDKNVRWKVKAHTNRQTVGEVLIHLKIKKATLGAGFTKLGIIPGRRLKDPVNFEVPVYLRVGNREFETTVPSEFKFAAKGRKARGSGSME